MNATTWDRVYGPDDTFFVCGDDALFEIGSVYKCGDEYIELVYYVYRQESDDRFGVDVMTHYYRQTESQFEHGDSDDDEYSYDTAGYLSHDTYEQAEREARRFASADESWKFQMSGVKS